MDRVHVRFEPGGESVPVLAGSAVHAAACAAGVALDAPCGGLGRCGRCLVRVDGPVFPPTRDELRLITREDLARGVRLACRARVRGDVTVHVTKREAPVIVTGSTSSSAPEGEPPTERGIDALEDSPYLLGAAVDIGTTTVVASLVDLENGDVLGTSGMLNVQYPWGADVMTRVTMAMHEGVAILARPIAMQVERMLSNLLDAVGAGPADLREIAIVGNTVMTNAFLGADLTPLGAAPYSGAVLDATYISAARAGMPRFELATCYVLPGASAFVGADVVAGVLATNLDQQSDRALMLDLGTNAEMVLTIPEGLLAASAAAGPALEGAGITAGMRAEPGAIERVWLVDGDIALATVGGIAPVGICGSGVLDLVAAMLDAGVLDASGRLITGVPGPVGSRVIERDDVRVFVVDADAGVVFSQKDVRAVQLAVGAVRTALDLLLAESGVRAGELSKVFIAGGFGYHVDARSLVRLGMVPAVWAEKISFVGNTAIEGARLALISTAMRRKAEKIARAVSTLSLADHPQFHERYIASLEFPRL
ncbi:MAG: ASKHA domain-containing protein [Coriobacteriales bacterium]